MDFFRITQKSKKSRARLGIIKTTNGILHTPAFFPVATQAVLKTLDNQDIYNLGFEGILCNTYHLMLKPGSKLVKRQGGLHQFINYNGVIATDSGGFQVFSLGKAIEDKASKLGKNQNTKEPGSFSKKSLVKVKEEGVYFKSHLDGSEHFLSPELSIKIQQELGADIIFAFDQPSSPLDNYEKTKKAMEQTHRWAEVCLKQKQTAKNKLATTKQALFGILQGGEYKNLRQESARIIGAMDFDGFGIGGSFGKSYGDSKKNIAKVLKWTMPLLPENKPRHMLGIGYLDNLEVCIKNGIDLFDCVWPTRLARHGSAIVGKNKTLNLNQAKFLTDKKPLLAKCQCPTCQNYSRAYICHLIRAKEITGLRLLTLHNLYFIKNFVQNIKERIKNGKF